MIKSYRTKRRKIQEEISLLTSNSNKVCNEVIPNQVPNTSQSSNYPVFNNQEYYINLDNNILSSPELLANELVNTVKPR